MEKREWNAPGLRYLIKYRIWPENKDSHHNDEWNEFFIEDPFMVICVLYFSNVGCSLKKFQHNTNEILARDHNSRATYFSTLPSSSNCNKFCGIFCCSARDGDSLFVAYCLL